MRLIVMLSICTILMACRQEIPVSEIEAEIRAVEEAFNQMAKEEGFKAAFLHFATDEAILVRGDQLVEGKLAIATYFDRQSMLTTSLTWTPDHVIVSEARDMAFSFGKYQFSGRDANGEQVNSEGVFRTLWKKQPDGQWRYLVD